MSADEPHSLPVEEMQSLAIDASSPPETPSTKTPAAEPLASAAQAPIAKVPDDAGNTVAAGSAPAEIVKSNTR